MSLTGAINIGRSALTASQLGLQISGNNIANVGTPGYSRQVGHMVPTRGDNGLFGASIGRGVQVRDVRRQIDEALQARLWNGTSDQSAATTQYNILSQIETALGELNDNDLSSEMSAFFRAWSERANQSDSSSSVVRQGEKLAGFMQRLRSDLSDQRALVDSQLGAGVNRANQIIEQIAGMNRAVADAEAGGNTANTLRDQRDQLVSELSTLMDVSVVDRGPEGLDVLVGSSPVVLGSVARGLEMRRENHNGSVQVSVRTIDGGAELRVSSGQLGALLNGRTTAIDQTIDRLDDLAGQLIFEVNRLHSTGANAQWLTSSSGTLQISAADRTRSLNNPANASFANLPYAAQNGGFLVNIRNEATGATQTVRINVDLDGVNAAGVAGTTDDTTAEDIRASLSAIPGLTATFGSDGRLQIEAAEGFEFSFSDDTSGALAVLGVNSYFTGTDAGTIGIRSDLAADPARLTVGRIIDGTFVENGTALAIRSVQDTGLTALGGRTLAGAWSDAVGAVGMAAASARTNSEAATVVKDSLEAQRASVSGVSLDEEAINLMNFQRQYQGAARLISIADELTQTLFSLV